MGNLVRERNSINNTARLASPSRTSHHLRDLFARGRRPQVEFWVHPTVHAGASTDFDLIRLQNALLRARTVGMRCD
jgi:hypothetical protein